MRHDASPAPLPWVLSGVLCLLSACSGPAPRPGDFTARAADLAAGPDPGQPGPRASASFALAVPVGGGASVSTTVVGPSDDGMTLSAAGAPFPLVIVTPGFTIPPAQYVAYADRLASHGFVAVLQQLRDQADHAQCRQDTIAVLSWLLSPTGAGAPAVQGRIDPARVGLTGHSLGGKISILVTAADPRVKALMAIDPVDGPAGQPEAVTVIGGIRLAAGAPLGMLGETVSSMGALACAPAAENYQVLYAAAGSPAFAITFAGAAHLDFLSDPATCGVACALCPGSTAPKARTLALAVKYVAAYFLWTLAGDAGAQGYLTGAEFALDEQTGAVSEVTK